MQLLCTICTDALSGDNELSVTKCGHVFHHQCLLTWFTISQTCPKCRRQSSHEDIVRLYLDIERDFLETTIDTRESFEHKNLRKATILNNKNKNRMEIPIVRNRPASTKPHQIINMSESTARLLIARDDGRHKLITFTLSSNSTVREILDKVGTEGKRGVFKFYEFKDSKVNFVVTLGKFSKRQVKVLRNTAEEHVRRQHQKI